MINKEKIVEIIREETWVEVDSSRVYGIEEAAEKVLQAIEAAEQLRAADECWAVRETHLSSSWKFCPYCGASVSTHR